MHIYKRPIGIEKTPFISLVETLEYGPDDRFWYQIVNGALQQNQAAVYSHRMGKYQVEYIYMYRQNSV